MKTIVVASVHNESKNTYSSKDFSGYKEFSSGVKAIKWIEENKICFGKEPEKYIDSELGLIIFYLPPVEHNFQREKFENLFIDGYSDDVKMYWDKQEDEKNKKREYLGFVVSKKYEDIQPNDYIGHLNNSLIEYSKKYISGNHCGGYIGHTWRQFRHDDFVENFMNSVVVKLDDIEIDKWNLFGVWITSTNARHWMDSVEDDYENIQESFTKFQDKFANSIADIMFTAFVYDHPEHNGTWRSTKILKQEFDGRISVEIL